MVAPDGKVLDSESELKLYTGQLVGLSCHAHKIPYIIPHTYNPDFVLETDKGMLVIECKGFFQDSAEAAKYKHIRDVLKEGDELIFIFDRPNNKLPWAKRRKDGTFLTHGEWATINGFRSYSPKDSREDILGDYNV